MKAAFLLRSLKRLGLGGLALAGTVLVPAVAQASTADELESQFDRALAAPRLAPQAASAAAGSASSGVRVNRGMMPPALARPVVQAVSAQAVANDNYYNSKALTEPAFTQPASRPAVQRFVPSAAPQAYGFGLEGSLAALTNSAMGRIGVAALDLSSGRQLAVLGNQQFPLASTSKIAIAAAFLQGVDQGRFKLTDQFPLIHPIPSGRFSSAAAPVRKGAMMSALDLIELSITRSSNPAADALLAAVGGPQAVNRWLRSAGISGIRMDRDIATLVRDDGEYNPATTIDARDSATPQAMVELLGGLYQGQWLSGSSRNVLIGAMGRTVTGRYRMRAMLPESAAVAHKTGTLSNTSSDVGFVNLPDGRVVAVAIYVTGQGGKPARDSRIAGIARAIYDGYQSRSLAFNTLSQP